MRAQIKDLIARKRDGGELSAEEIAAIIDPGVPDHQLAAFLMAVVLREEVSLLVMFDSVLPSAFGRRWTRHLRRRIKRLRSKGSDAVPDAVIRVIDVKCPGSSESAKNHWPNLERLRPTDEIKFVIKDRADYEYARDVVATHTLIGRCAAVHFSPVHGVQDARQLSEWILADKIAVRLQLQAHKYIWDPQTRGV